MNTNRAETGFGLRKRALARAGEAEDQSTLVLEPATDNGRLLYWPSRAGLLVGMALSVRSLRVERVMVGHHIVADAGGPGWLFEELVEGVAHWVSPGEAICVVAAKAPFVCDPLPRLLIRVRAPRTR